MYSEMKSSVEAAFAPPMLANAMPERRGGHEQPQSKMRHLFLP